MITPLANRVLLRPIPHIHSETLVIPEQVEQPEVIRAKVIALGPRTKGHWPFEIGAIVITTDFMGAEVMVSRSLDTTLPTFLQRHLIMREKDILAIIEP